MKCMSPYLATQMKEGDFVSLAGKVEYTVFGLEMRSPEWEKGKGGVHTARMVPVYPLTAGVTNRQMRFLISRALVAVGEVEEWIDENFQFSIFKKVPNS